MKPFLSHEIMLKTIPDNSESFARDSSDIGNPFGKYSLLPFEVYNDVPHLMEQENNSKA